MTKDLPRVVVDTCVILDFLVGDDSERLKRARSVLDDHGKKHIVVLPAIVVPEISGSGTVRNNAGGKADRQSRIARAMAWIGGSGFIVAELDEGLARKSATLAVEHDLKGPDATVLATALKWSQTLYTRDNGLLKVDLPNLRILEPPVPASEWTLLTSAGAVPE